MLPAQKHQNGKAMLKVAIPKPAKGRADGATHVVARVVDGDGAIEIVLGHQHRRDDEPCRRRKRAAAAETKGRRQQHGRGRPMHGHHRCEDDRHRGHSDLRADQHPACVDDVGQRAGRQGQEKHRQRRRHLDRRHHHRVRIETGHEPVRRSVEHRETDVRGRARDQHDRERQIAENAPAPGLGYGRVRLGAGLDGQQNPLGRAGSDGPDRRISPVKWRTRRKVSRRRSAKDGPPQLGRAP